MAVAVTAVYMNISLCHTMGGEITGTVDESIRHAITKLAHIHFPANKQSAERIIKMGEKPENVHIVGCPRIDEVAQCLKNDDLDQDGFKEYKGVGEIFSLNEPFLLVSQHPVTTEYGQGRMQIRETLRALDILKMHTIMLWPNVDAGSEDIVKEIRTFREFNKPDYLHLFKNLPIKVYVKLMDKCKCMIGNSSSAIREGAYIGVPAVNIGTRQNGREKGENIIDVDYNCQEIVDAARKQIKAGKYAPDYIYGDGKAAEKIVDILLNSNVAIQKKLVY